MLSVLTVDCGFLRRNRFDSSRGRRFPGLCAAGAISLCGFLLQDIKIPAPFSGYAVRILKITLI